MVSCICKGPQGTFVRGVFTPALAPERINAVEPQNHKQKVFAAWARRLYLNDVLAPPVSGRAVPQVESQLLSSRPLGRVVRNCTSRTRR